MTKNIRWFTMKEILINNVGVSEEAVKLATKLNGKTKRVYEDILFLYTGYSSFDKYLDEVSVDEK